MESYSTIAKAFILLVVSIYSVYARECSIQGLPSSAFRRGDIYFLEFRQESSVKITLECRCSAYFPIWNHYKMNSFDTDTISDFDQVKCRKDGKDCSRKFINPKVGAPGFYVYRKTTFLIDEPSVLTCSSTKNKEMVIISVKQEEPKPAAPCPSSSESLSAVSTRSSQTVTNLNATPIS